MTDVVKKFEPLFEPKSIAFIGASRNPLKWGYQIPSNLIEFGYDGNVYPVNPHESDLFKLKVYRTLDEIPEQPIDLAVATVPSRVILEVVKDCAEAGVKALIVIAAGFGELGDEGAGKEAEMARIARDSGMLLVGPNCAGVVSPEPRNLYCQMPPVKTTPGCIAMASQSGNIGKTIQDLATKYHVGISRLVSTGNEAFLHMEDYLEYFGEDTPTKVVASYVEGVDDGRRFLNIARDVSRKKPVVVLKVGRTQAGQRAARSHTGALAGSREIFHGACRQAGLTEVADVEELFDTITAFARQPIPRGRRVGIVSEGGGWGVLAADACAEFGLEVVDLPEHVLKQLDSFLPSWWSRGNPVDLVGGMVDQGVAKCAEILLACDEVDGVIALGVAFLARQAAEYRRRAASGTSKLASPALYEQIADIAIERDLEWIGELVKLIDRYQKPMVVAADTVFTAYEDKNEALFALMGEGVMVYPTPRRAARAFAHLVERHEYLASVGAV